MSTITEKEIDCMPNDIPRTLVAISEDPRESELLTLFRSADERGKHCMIAMARAMPCMRGG